MGKGCGRQASLVLADLLYTISSKVHIIRSLFCLIFCVDCIISGAKIVSISHLKPRRCVSSMVGREVLCVPVLPVSGTELKYAR